MTTCVCFGAFSRADFAAEQLTGHAEVHDQRVGSVEAHDQVLPPSLDRHDLAALEQVGELLFVLVPAHRPRSGDVDGFDLLADYVLLEIAA